MILFRSQIPGQSWPAFVEPRGAILLALAFQLEQSQWWPPEVLRERQLAQLAPLLRHAWETVDGYRDLWGERGRGIATRLDAETFAALPVLHRATLQEGPRRWRTRHYPKAHGPVAMLMTSGSTGTPVEVLHSEIHRSMWRTLTLRNEVWHRRDVTRTIASIRHLKDGSAPPPAGERRPSWGSGLEALIQTGPAALLSLSATIEEQAAWLPRQGATYLLTFPTNLHALAEHFIARGGGPPLEQVVTLGETLTDETREVCRQAFGAGVKDMYSSQEVGYIALQCPDHETYHVQAENVLVEVLDEEDRPCGPGEVGRVVVTSLTNWASPLIRYEVGDYAEVGEPCPCGRGLPTLRRIMGRVRNMLVLPDGSMRWPSIVSKQCRAVAPFRQIQLVHVAPEEIEVRIVPDTPLTQAQREGLTGVLHGSLGWPFRMRFVEMEEIPRSKSGKFEQFLSLRGAYGG